jgi:hypothetical protein
VVNGSGEGGVVVERRVDYGLALLWHRIGVDERDVLEPPARAVSGLGVAVVVPDWESEAADGGRAHLLASVDADADAVGR